MKSQAAILQFPETDNVRPKAWAGFVGQQQAVRVLQVGVKGALSRADKLPHVLIAGSPGLGKTTIASILAAEMGVSIKVVQGPELDSPAALASVAMELGEFGILFIDEAHRAKPQALETLYEVMEPSEAKSFYAQSFPNLTVVAATTNPGRLPQPFKDRFRLKIELQFYSTKEVTEVLVKAGKMLNMKVDELAAEILATAAHGVPRVGINYLLFGRDLATAGEITLDIATEALSLLGIDPNGYTDLQRRYLHSLAYRHNGGPASLDTIAAGISKDRDSVIQEIEPVLLRNNFIIIMGKGRKLTGHGSRYVRENIAL